MHEEDPDAEYEPGAHGEHAEEPADAEYVPAAHGEHSEAPPAE